MQAVRLVVVSATAEAPVSFVRSGTYVPWDLLAAISLRGCDRGRPADPDSIRRFVAIVIDAIGMRAHGGLALDRFGDGDREGWSAMQFIETGSLTLHADEVFGRCFVDVFSLRPP